MNTQLRIAFLPLTDAAVLVAAGCALGYATLSGFIALLGLLGVRLGYWWRAGDTTARAPHMLTALWHEITGAFNPDTSSHWYLSDGGHFENTAACELIRRRVKRIVLADWRPERMEYLAMTREGMYRLTV